MRSLKNNRYWELLSFDEEMQHRPLTEKFVFYRAVATGEEAAVRRNCEQRRFLDTEGVGVLSKDPVTNLKYHMVITTAMLARICRQNGMEMEQAFQMSDYYIQQLDDMHTQREVHDLHDEMVLDYTRSMKRLARKDSNSKHVIDGKEYIYNHIRERITVDILADEMGVSSGHLSRLFKAETGMSVSDYIREQKINMAKNLLRFSENSMIEIANLLSFSSQSHFIKQFKASEGITPKKYKDLHYMEPLDREITLDE